jgi:uncharacterized membrane protein YozB (DUF420 family)
MMSLPFLALLLGLAAAWKGRRNLAMGCWLGGVVLILVFLRLHATQTLDIML